MERRKVKGIRCAVPRQDSKAPQNCSTIFHKAGEGLQKSNKKCENPMFFSKMVAISPAVCYNRMYG